MIQGIIDAIVTGWMWGIRWIFARLMEGLAGLLNTIPAPAWLDSAGPLIGQAAGSVGWIVEPLQLPFGLSVIGSALSVFGGKRFRKSGCCCQVSSTANPAVAVAAVFWFSSKD